MMSHDEEGDTATYCVTYCIPPDVTTSPGDTGKARESDAKVYYVIPENTRENRLVSVTGQPLLSPPQSPPHDHPNAKVTKSKFKKCVMNRKKLLLVLLGIVAAIILLLLILIIRRVHQNNSNVLCTDTRNSSLDSSSACDVSTFGCGAVEDVLLACTSKSLTSWRMFTRDHTEWETHNITFQGISDKVESILISPYFSVPHDSCSFNFSLCQIQYSKYFVIDEQGHINHHLINTTSTTACHQSLFLNSNFLSKASHLQLAIVTSQSTAIERIRFTLRFQPCLRYSEIAERHNGKELVGEPRFAVVDSGHAENQCSFEHAEDRRLKCDWWTVETNEPNVGAFKLAEKRRCVESGLVSIPIGEKWFIYLDTTESGGRTTFAYVISPLFRANSSHVSLSYYYRMPCAGGAISVYITPPQSQLHVLDYIKYWSPWSQVRNRTDKWDRVDLELAVPQWEGHDSFHILIRAELDGSGSCSNESRCAGDKPMIAVDEITAQLRFDQCQKAKGGHEILGCGFDDENEPYCKWKSSGGEWTEDWTIKSNPDPVVQKVGALEKHFIGRGNITEFHPLGKANVETIYLRSPVLIANSNCSCTMQMSYLMRSKYVRRLTVLIKYGEDQDDHMRPHTKLWSAMGMQSDDWLEADILINLVDNKIPFQIEIRPSQIFEGSGYIYLDDFRFLNCDVSLVADATDDYDYEDEYGLGY